ncbi:MAG: DegT/DnrJ/EryC1/StrS family aminotransferase [Candidatus Binatia bacterium]
MKVPLLDLKAQYQTLRSQISVAMDKVLESQTFILGPVVARFEEEIASYLGCRAAIGVASGSDALLLSLMALDTGPGCGVVVPPFTFFATVSCIVRLGAIPVFVDVDPDTCLVTGDAIESVLADCTTAAGDGGLHHRTSRSRIKVLLPVHLFGQTCDMRRLSALAARYGLALVEDVAQAMGARMPPDNGVSQSAGTVGDLGCFSFFPTKNLGGIGDGGLVATNRADLAEKIRALRMHGEGARYHHEFVGINSRLDEIQASVLAVKLRCLDQWCRQRVERAETYRNLLTASGLLGQGLISLPHAGGDRTHVFNYYVIRVDRRDPLKQYLSARGVQTAVYYPIPLHLQPCFKDLGYRRGEFPNAERIASEVLALPMYPELTFPQQEYVVHTIRNFFLR